MEIKFSKGTTVVLFIVVLFLLFWNVGIFTDLNKRPQGMHQWAQCDRASVARNYYEKDFNFFLPRVNNVANGTGITGMEFPIINWTVACFYKAFGFNEMYYRLLMLLLFSASLFSAFLITYKFTNGNFLFSMLSVLLYACSPVLMFYAASFIPDIAAASFTMIAWCIFLTTDLSKQKNIIWLGVFLALGCLIKITCIISAIAILILVSYQLIGKKKESGTKSTLLFPSVISILLTAAWYSYSNYLNTKYDAGFFLMHPKPVSGLSDLSFILTKLSEGMAKEYYAYGYQWILIAINLVILIFKRHADKKLLLITALLYAGNFCFFLLMAAQFIEHDYYIITLLTTVFFNLVLFFNVIESLIKNRIAKIILGIAMLLFSNYMMVYCKKNHTNRYHKDNWHYDILADRLFDIEPYLNSIGVAKKDTVIFYADPSPNISLYLMGRSGVAIARESISDLNRWTLKPEFKYLFIDNTTYLSNPIIQPLINNKIIAGKWQGITIYKLHD